MRTAGSPSRRVEAVRGDITAERVDAIVNAANSSLLGGGGVDGAIHRAAGPRLLAACREVRRDAYPDGLPVGDAVATSGADLPARWVIHTVGPNWHRGQRDPHLLRGCFTRSLDVAAEVFEEVGYDGAFTFVFSPRRETEAATMGEQLPHPVKVERMERLVEAVQRRAAERAQRFVGRTLDVLVEGTSRTDETKLRGRTRHGKAVNFDGIANPGEFVAVEIDFATSQSLGGVSVKPLSQLFR